MKYLRAVEPEDLDLMYVVENDAAISRYSSTTVPLSCFALKQYIENSSGDLYADAQVRLTIVDPQNGSACGFLDITDLSAKHRRAQVGIALLPEVQGRGVATGALREAEHYARQQGLFQLYAIVAVDNYNGRLLFDGAGYDATAVLQEWLLMDGEYMDAIVFQHSYKSDRITAQ